MNANDISIRLSGGASNSDPTAALGGIMSSNSPGMQSSTATSISGMTVLEVGGLIDGAGTISVDYNYGDLYFVPPEGVRGPHQPYVGRGNTTYMLTGGSGIQGGYVLVSVVEASLPTSNTDDVIDITTVSEGIFADATVAQATAGGSQYRCLYVTNTHATESVINLGLFILADTPGADSMSYAFDTDAGVGDGSTTGVATTIVDETDPTNLLSSLTFNAVTDPESASMLSDTIPAGDTIAVWVKRTIPPYVPTEVIDNTFAIGVKAYLGA